MTTEIAKLADKSINELTSAEKVEIYHYLGRAHEHFNSKCSEAGLYVGAVRLNDEEPSEAKSLVYRMRVFASVDNMPEGAICSGQQELIVELDPQAQEVRMFVYDAKHSTADKPKAVSKTFNEKVRNQDGFLLPPHFIGKRAAELLQKLQAVHARGGLAALNELQLKLA